MPSDLSADTKTDVVNALSDGVVISAQLKQEMSVLTDSIESLSDSYTKLADALAGGKHPNKPPAPFSIDGFASKIDTLASQIEAVQPPAIKDTSSYSVSGDSLADCSTQDGALQKLHAYADGLDEVIAMGKADLGYAQQYGTAVNIVYSNVVSLQHDFGIMASTPNEMDGFFVGQWSELDGVLKAISRLQNANTNYIGRMSANLSDMQTRSNNLRSNLTLFPPQSCLLVGSWSGTCVMAVSGITSSATVFLNRVGYQQDGTFSFLGTGFPGSNPHINSKTSLVFPFGKNNGAVLSGSFDPQYSHFSGSVVISSPIHASYSCKLAGAGS